MYKYMHTCIFTHIYVRTHTHIHIYTHTHTKCTYERMQARLERRRGSERARSRCRERKLCTSLSFDQSNHSSHLQCKDFIVPTSWNTNTSPPPIPFSQHTPEQFAVADCGQAQFYCSTLMQMNRVHSSEEAPRSFTMAPCVVVERLEGKQRCSRATVSQHAGIQAREYSSWLFTKKREVNEKTTKPCNSPHTMTTARRPDNIPLICTGAGPIHPVHIQPMSLATEAPKWGYISAIFPPFHMCDMTNSRMWYDLLVCVTWCIHLGDLACDMTHSHVWVTLFHCYVCVKRLNLWPTQLVDMHAMTYSWQLLVCDTTHSHAATKSSKYVTWRIHSFGE